MKKYFVIYSSDPYLLARLCTDLQMMKAKVNTEWCDHNNPFDGWAERGVPTYYLYTHCQDGFMEFHNHCGESKDKEIMITLTSRNYLSVLTQILEP